MNEQLAFPGEGQSVSPELRAPEDLPLIYLVSSLTGLNKEGQTILDNWCTTIGRVAADCQVRCHAPIVTSAPWKDQGGIAAGGSPKEIFKTNFAKVASADALIVLTYRGGGFGGGQEITWGVAARIPILLLAHQNEAISRQLQGTPGDIEVVRFQDSADLEIKIKQFISSRSDQLAAHVRARKSRRYLYLKPMETMRESWSALSDKAKEAVSARTGIHQQQVQTMLRDADGLALASVDEFLALAGALDLRAAELLDTRRLPALSAQELSALRMTAREYELSGVEVLDLQVRGQLEFAKGGIRRFRLLSPEDWIAFRNDTL